MSDAIRVLCPGQGAQSVGMGQKWRSASAAAARVFDEADRIVGSRFGAPMSDICFNGPESVLNRTDVAQPAIFVVGVACFRAMQEASPVRVELAAGLSLGEYTALHVAGSFGFEEGLKLVLLRGRAMQDAAEAVSSGMVALIGADDAQARQVCDAAAGGDVLVPANYNAPGQIVLSGSMAACDRAVETASTLGLRATKLAVAGAFHSPLMAPAAEKLAQALAGTSIKAPTCPVYANVSAMPHDAEPDSIRRRLVQQLTSPVLWNQSCSAIAALPGGDLHELAPGKVLAGLMRRIDRNTKVATHDEPLS